MEELTRMDIEDWLETHGMMILAEIGNQYLNGKRRKVWLYHRETRCGNWVNWEFIMRVVNSDAGIWPIEEF